MFIEKKENYTLVSSNEDSFSDFFTAFSKMKEAYKSEHLVLDISKNINITKEEFLLFLSDGKKKHDKSFVIVYNIANIDDLPQNFNIVPTLIEAEDILEMEAIERELGF
ncbi:hypothetical protein [Polaribacter glomeratus]|uniref:Uncharacterized protein n=1 Tax=Polaribacter glomeratus TaxID=102 RepID=A0A2S7WY18_9FLAO|nr:hypothetical protein [Polaribacter glomeratus]PQJ82428.1 hypothetical protein BTO16_07475 [Polaribacter glomeratus]TXD64333.1 hypothetical protein ESX12_15615 [Polaribacter glomeratus]